MTVDPTVNPYQTPVDTDTDTGSDTAVSIDIECQCFICRRIEFWKGFVVGAFAIMIGVPAVALPIRFLAWALRD